MKKILAAILALTIVTGVAAPTFAAQADTTCTYTNKVFCDVGQSLVDSQTDYE